MREGQKSGENDTWGEHRLKNIFGKIRGRPKWRCTVHCCSLQNRATFRINCLIFDISFSL